MSVYPKLVESQNITVIKLLMLGESNVGKTSIVTQYTDHTFNSNLLTLGVDLRQITKKVRGQYIRLELWDTAGQEKYSKIPSQYYKSVHGIILVYDITVGETFQKIQEWLNRIEQNRKLDDLILMLVGNKVDLEEKREVNKNQAEKFATAKTMKFRETSAIESEHVQLMVNQIINCVLQNKKMKPEESIILEQNKIKNNECC